MMAKDKVCFMGNKWHTCFYFKNLPEMSKVHLFKFSATLLNPEFQSNELKPKTKKKREKLPI
jgi:hypothetical protein